MKTHLPAQPMGPSDPPHPQPHPHPHPQPTAHAVVRARQTKARLTRPLWLAAALGWAGALSAVGAVSAQTLPEPRQVVSLSASASEEVPQDWLTIVMSASRDGADAATVQAQLRQALDVALTEARRAARPGELEVKSGGFSVNPRYANPKPGQAPTIAGWTGTAEIVIEGRDTVALGRLATRLQTLTVSRMGFSLSRQARERVEAQVTEQAVQSFRTRAAAVAKHFGFNGYSLREVSVSGAEGDRPQPMAYAMRANASSKDQESLPVEAGKALVSVNVSGSVQLQ